jgi:CRISPR-associated protein Csm4
MRTARARLVPQSAFGTPPLGDTLFGQLCWAIRNRAGEARLTELLEGYRDGRPYLVVSDLVPAGYLPLPSLPGHCFAPVEGLDRKQAKKRRWVPLEAVSQPVREWLRAGVADTALSGGWYQPHLQPHNSIDRRTGTTGPETFAPYTMTQYWFGKTTDDRGQRSMTVGPLDVYLLFDETRLSTHELVQALSDVGTLGFGRDASIGLGRFSVETLDEMSLPAQERANAWLTLAPCAPQGLRWQPERCFYHVFTRFGRHGDLAVHFENPFKTPVLLTAGGSVFTPAKFEPRLFIGQGLGGDGSLSKAVRHTVHQGYAPVVAIRLDQPMDTA